METDLELITKTFKDRNIDMYGYAYIDPPTGQEFKILHYNEYMFKFNAETGEFVEGYQYIGKRWRETKMLVCRALDMVEFGSTINKPKGMPNQKSWEASWAMKDFIKEQKDMPKEYMEVLDKEFWNLV